MCRGLVEFGDSHQAGGSRLPGGYQYRLVLIGAFPVMTRTTRSGGMPEPRPPPASSAQVSRVMKANRSTATGPERKLRQALITIGLGGCRMNVRGIPGRPDIAYVNQRVAVFVNGCFWHHHGCTRSNKTTPKTNSEYWRMKFRANQERDLRKVRELEKAGWLALICWECEIEGDSARVANRVSAQLSKYANSRRLTSS